MNNSKINNFYKYSLAFIFFITLGALLGLFFIPHFSFDFPCYHFYNGWAFWNDRIDIDLMPASYRSYLNPLLDGINYKLIEWFIDSPKIYLFFINIKYGFYMFAAFVFLDTVFKLRGRYRNFIIFWAFIFCVFSPMVLLTRRLDVIDLWTNAIGLLSISMVLKCLFSDDSKKRNLMLLSASILAGVALGLKYTAISLVLGLIISIIFNAKSINNPKKIIILSILGIIAGFLITNGYWMYKVYSHFQNPFFPYFNGIFKSPMGNSDSVLISDFQHIRSDSIIKFIFQPLMDSSRYFHIGSEALYFDIKYPLTFISILILFIINQFSKPTYAKFINPAVLNTLFIYTISVYYTNSILFNQLRYTIALMPVCAVIIFTFLYTICKFLNKNKYFIKVLNICNNVYVKIVLSILVIASSFAIRYRNEHWFKYFIYFVLMCTIFYLLIFIWKNKSKFYGAIFAVLLLYLINFQSSAEFASGFSLNSIRMAPNHLINDDSMVLLASLRANWLVPLLNANARYIGLSMPTDLLFYTKDKKEVSVRGNYNSDYLANYIKEQFQAAKDVYLIYLLDDIPYGEEKRVIEGFEKAISYYSQGKINGSMNCRNYMSSFNFICKVK